MMAGWLELSSLPEFKALGPTEQLTMADKFFADQSGLDPGAPEFQDLRVKWREQVMPTLNMGQATDGQRAQDFSGNQVSIDQLSEFAKMGHGMANTLENWGLGAKQLASELPGGAPQEPGMPTPEAMGNSEARAMELQHQPIDETVSGTIGGALPYFAAPMGGTAKVGAQGLAKAGQVLGGLGVSGAGGAALGALEPVTGEGQRGRNVMEGAASFAGGDAAGRTIGAVGRRMRYPQLGGKQTSAPAQARQTARMKGIDELEQQGFRIPTGQRSGSNIVQGIESVFPEIITTSGAAGRMAAENKVNLNEIVARSFGKGNAVAKKGVIDDEVISKAAQNIGAKIEAAIPPKTVVGPSTKFLDEMGAVQKEVQAGLPSMESSPVSAAIKDIYQKMYEEGPQGITKLTGISGKDYQVITSQLTDLRRKLFRESDRKGAMHVGQVQKILDDRLEETLRATSPDVLRNFRSARRQWGGLRIAEEAVDEAGDVQIGKLKDAVKRHRPQDLVARAGRQRSDLGTLAKNVKVLQQVIPNSGTPMRTGAKSLIQGGQGLLGGVGAYEAYQGNPYPAIGGLLGPMAIQRMLYSPRFARYATRVPNAMAGQSGGFGNALSELARTGLGLGGYGALQSQNQ